VIVASGSGVEWVKFVNMGAAPFGFLNWSKSTDVAAGVSMWERVK
jgi:hypothetical protein